MNNTTRTWIKDGLWVIALAGLVASIIRFASGLVVMSGNFLGDWIRDKLDPRLRQL